MKAIQISQSGDASVLQLQNLPAPKPSKGEALVKLKAAGLNLIDIYMRSRSSSHAGRSTNCWKSCFKN